MSYWQYIPGPDLSGAYDEIVRSVSDGDIVVESQCGFGRGTHYLMEAFKARGVRPRFYAFDTFGERFGSEYWEDYPSTTPWGEPFDQWAARVGGPSRLIDQFTFHLRNSPAREYLTDWAQFPHWTVAEEFKDDTVKYVITGGRTIKTRDEEVRKWWPKLKSGGLIACHPVDGSVHWPTMLKA